MKNRIRNSLLATASAVFLAAGLAFAGLPGLHRSSRKSADIDIVAVTRVPGGPTLQPGIYKVILLNESLRPEVGFYRDGKLIGQAPVELVEQPTKFHQTELDASVLDDHSQLITDMRLSGWTEKVIFGEPDVSRASGE